jgi:hypothetical protein
MANCQAKKSYKKILFFKKRLLFVIKQGFNSFYALRFLGHPSLDKVIHLDIAGYLCTRHD